MSSPVSLGAGISGRRGALAKLLVGLCTYTEIWVVSKEIGHSSVRMKWSPGRHRQWPSGSCLVHLFGGGVGEGEEENTKLLKNTHVENGKTVRLSYV